jgi:NAD(P)H-flavin reductase
VLKPGDAVTIEGSLGRYKPNLANARSVVMTATGQKLGAASSEASR